MIFENEIIDKVKQLVFDIEYLNTNIDILENNTNSPIELTDNYHSRRLKNEFIKWLKNKENEYSYELNKIIRH